jgi:hypothetical protein
MRTPMTARDTRLNRDDGGTSPLTADPDCDVSNLLFRPRAGNLSGDTRAGLSSR